MRRGVVVLIVLLLCVSAFSTRKALIIGIGDYPQNVDNYWNHINGDHDMVIVNQMLLENGFERRNIVSLVNSEATYQAIKNAFCVLVDNAMAGDVVYIHFSGHGQLITDVNGDEGDYGWDEAWIPYDAQQVPSRTYKGQCHLVDDELNVWLHSLRNKVGKDGKIIVVADACHSSGATRDVDDDEVVRGTSANFVIRGGRSAISAPNTVEWLYFSACRSDEVNRQCKGKVYGSLTYSLYMLRDKLSILPAEKLMEEISSCLQTLVPRVQTPQMEGPSYYKSVSIF